jgi:hypothetical protein
MQISVTETDTGLEFTTGRVEIFIEWWPTNTIHNRKAAPHSATPELLQLLTS